MVGSIESHWHRFNTLKIPICHCNDQAMGGDFYSCCSMQISESVINAYEDRTMATASLRTLSPKSKAYRSTSTLSSWKIASTVTEIQRKITLNIEQGKSTEDYLEHPPKGSRLLPETTRTWVRGRYDGSKEETVREVKVSAQLTHSLHEPHKAVHDQSEERRGEHEESEWKTSWVYSTARVCESHPIMKQEVSVPTKA